jgi:RNA polymerase sigma factor (sigma-70 family)
VDADLPLIRALQTGDDSALDELIRRHQEPLLRFVYRYLRNEAAAREVVHETFVRTYFKAAKFQPRATVKTWIYAIALNLCRDEGRRIQRNRGSHGLKAEHSSGAERIDPGLTPDEQAAERDQFSKLQSAIDQLSPSLREALVLFSLDGRSQKEAAAILRTTPKTLELRVYRAKARLRELLVGMGVKFGTK